jgi:putative endopeptidase
MNRMTALMAATTALTACTSAPPEAAAPATPAEVVAPPAPAPKPTYGTFGFDTAGMDASVLPGNNFYQYANGTWAKNTPIPADKSNYGMFTVLDDLSRERTKTLIEQSAQDSNSRIGATYASFMDEAAVVASGLAQ